MRHILPIAILFIISVYGAGAQDIERDTTIVEKTELQQFFDKIQTSSFGRQNVTITQSDSMYVALERYIEKNKVKPVNGYRLRIFFDNKQNARTVSEQIVTDFFRAYPHISIYRIYQNPYFKVTVGDFRTKSEAMKFMEEIRPKYPSVFLVREKIDLASRYTEEIPEEEISDSDSTYSAVLPPSTI